MYTYRACGMGVAAHKAPVPSPSCCLAAAFPMMKADGEYRGKCAARRMVDRRTSLLPTHRRVPLCACLEGSVACGRKRTATTCAMRAHLQRPLSCSGLRFLLLVRSPALLLHLLCVSLVRRSLLLTGGDTRIAIYIAFVFIIFLSASSMKSSALTARWRFTAFWTLHFMLQPPPNIAVTIRIMAPALSEHFVPTFAHQPSY